MDRQSINRNSLVSRTERVGHVLKEVFGAMTQVVSPLIRTWPVFVIGQELVMTGGESLDMIEEGTAEGGKEAAILGAAAVLIGAGAVITARAIVRQVEIRGGSVPEEAAEMISHFVGLIVVSSCAPAAFIAYGVAGGIASIMNWARSNF